MGYIFFCLKEEDFFGLSATKCLPTKKLSENMKTKHLNSRVYCGTVYPVFCAIRMLETCREQVGTESTGEVEMLFISFVLPTKAMGGISGGFPGSPQGQEEILRC